jgi:hypothetical protein
MGSIISKINDDYSDYQFLCERLNIESKCIQDMYSHERDILKEYGCKSTYELFENIKKSEKIDNKISSIIT